VARCPRRATRNIVSEGDDRTANHAVVYLGPGKVEVQSIAYPELQTRQGRESEHGVIIQPFQGPSRPFRLLAAGGKRTKIVAKYRDFQDSVLLSSTVPDSTQTAGESCQTAGGSYQRAYGSDSRAHRQDLV